MIIMMVVPFMATVLVVVKAKIIVISAREVYKRKKI